MASINGWWFLLLGAFVSIVSGFVVDGIEAFMYIGLIFIGYGVLKILISFVTSPKKTEEKKIFKDQIQQRPTHYTSGQNMHYNHAQRMQQSSQSQPGIFCRNCGKRSGIQDNFCAHCGMRLR